MLSNKAARTLVTEIIIAIHHAMFANIESVTGVTAWSVREAEIVDQKVYWLTISCGGRAGGESSLKSRSPQQPTWEIKMGLSNG
jgi:hypothetical protein